MPYFHNDKINVLFIHIPKTGGTSIEEFLSEKYNIKLNIKSLFNPRENFNPLLPNDAGKVSLQHQTLITLFHYRKRTNIKFKNLTVFTVVRNPYHKIVSDLFYFKLIKEKSTQSEVFKTLQEFIVSKNYDNHNLPQHEFISINNIIPKFVKILKLENIQEDIKTNKLFFLNNFNVNKNKGSINQNKYFNYLNQDSIKLINKVYQKDFEIFNYSLTE